MRSGCVGKEDFLPEESFQSWSNYWKAVKETGPRLKDRIVSRSTDQVEIEEVRSRSKHEMKKNLNWWDLIWFGVGSVIGSGIFVLTGQEANSDAGPAVVLSYVVSGISAMLSVFCYTEFAVEIPVAGGSFAYLRVELGDFVAYIAAGNILLEYIIGQAAVARSWTSYFTTLLNHNPDDFRILITSFPDGYNRLDPIAFAVLILIGLFACTSIKGPSVLNYIATIIHVATLLFIIIAGLFHVDSHNLTDQFVPFGPRGVFKAAAVLYFSYVGFDAVATMAEETKDPAKDIPRGLVGSMSITTVLYCAMAVVLVMMQKYTDIDANAPYSVAFERVGMGWAKYIVAFGALEGMTTVLLVAIVGQGRYLTHIARTHMLPPFFSRVNERTSTPINATLSLVFVSATLGFFTSLDVLANLLSISTLFIFTMVAVALLVRRYYVTGETSDSDRGKLGLSLVMILGASAATAGYWATSEGWVGYAVTVPLWLLGTVGLGWGVPMARKAKTWGVPLVPWLPSASIAINIFLLGSIDRLSFIRFGIWTGLLFVYYFFFGLHASYDTAKSVKQLVVVEDHVEPTKEIGMA